MERRIANTRVAGRGRSVSRRRVLGALAAGFALGSTAACGPTPASRPGRAALTDSPLIIDALGFLDDPNADQPEPFALRSVRAARAAKLTALNLSMGYVAGPDEPFERSLRDVGRWDGLVSEHSNELLKVWKSSDILTAKRESKLGLIYVFQNAAMLGADLDRVDVFAGLGVRAIGLTYNGVNQFGDGAAAARNGGLTELGREAIERLNARRVVVDLSHSGERTCLEAVRAARSPVSINHTGCRALADFPRNKTDEELRLVASRGGFVGIFFIYFLRHRGDPSATDVIAHIDHAVNVCGEEHVGIGTDGSVIAVEDLPAYRSRFAAEITERRDAGIASPGERVDTLPFVPELRGPSQFHDLAGRLERHGYGASRVERILGGNYLRFVRDVWGV